MILVTGATGKIGREVTSALAAAGSAVRVFARDARKAETLGAPGVEIAVGDLDSPDSVRAALAGVEKLFLLSPGDPRLVEQQGRAVEAAQRAGVRHIVKISALGAAVDSPVSVLRWHAQAEQQIEESGLDFTHLRPHYFMQNLLGFAASIAGEGRFHAPMKTGRIGLVDTRDVAAVAARVLGEPGHGGRIYEITGPEAHSFAELAAQIGDACGREVAYVDVSPSEAEKAMLAAGLPAWLADALNGLYGIFSAGHASRLTRVVEDVTGKPARTFAAFAREHARDFAPA